MAFQFTRLHHVQLALPPGGEDQARAFFSGVLGMDELPKPPVLAARGGCWFRGDGWEVHLGVEEDFRAARKAHPGVLVDDLDALAARLKTADVEVVWDDHFPGHRRIYAHDPFGNRLEFLEPHWDGHDDSSSGTGFDLAESIDLLSRTPAVLDALLRGLPDGWLTSDEGPGTWTATDVVGHLLHGEHVDWLPRTRHVLEHAPEVPWPPFDPDGAEAIVGDLDLDARLDAFAAMRAAGLAELAALDLSEDDLDRTTIHPTFGEVQLRQHLATWATHDLDHLRQITRALALRHREAIGPWTAFLTITD